MSPIIAAKEVIFRHGALRLAGLQWGNPEGKPVLCMHGWLDNSATFSKLAPALGEHNNLVAFDFAGHGKSSHRDWSQPYDALTHVHAAADVAQQLGWLDSGRKFSIIGHSMGAAVGVALTASLQNVHKLVVIDGLGFTTRKDDSAALHVKSCIQQRIKIKAITSAPRMYQNMVSSPDEAVKARVEKVKKFPGDQSLSEEAARALLERMSMVDEDTGRVYLLHLEKLRLARWGGLIDEILPQTHDPLVSANQQQYMTEKQVISLIHAVHCPTLVVTAQNGWPLTTDENSDARLKALGKNLHHVCFPGSHHLHLDPETSGFVTGEVRRFLDVQDPFDPPGHVNREDL